jgi:micrococcal nuclease
MRKFAALIFLTFILCGVGPLCAAQGRWEGRVSRVIDGDTFQLAGGGPVRLIGVDTPEYEPWKHRIDFYGKEAFLFSKKLLNGRRVFLEQDEQSHDKYGRLLAYVWLEDGLFVNEHLVEEGYAKAKRYPPNLRFQKIFKDAQENAKKSKKGMWRALDNLEARV